MGTGAEDRAERKAGELLSQTIQHGGDPKSHDVTLTLLGIEKMQSHRWQIEAQMCSWNELGNFRWR